MTLNIGTDPHQVTWANFQALTTGRNQFDAETQWSIQFSFQTTGHATGGRWSFASLVVTCDLVFGGCWVVSGRQTAPLLVHERGHYLIATLVAREFEAAAVALTASSVRGLQNAVGRLYTTEMRR